MKQIDFSAPIEPLGPRLSRLEMRNVLRYVMDKVSILDLAKFEGLPTRGHPGNICCWFHEESNPSARIKLSKQHYLCYAHCGYGDIFWVLKKLKGFSTGQSIRYLDENFHLGLGFRMDLTAAKEHRNELSEERMSLSSSLNSSFDLYAGVTRKMVDVMPRWLWYHWENIESCLWKEYETIGIGIERAEELAELSKFKERLVAWKKEFREATAAYAEKYLTWKRNLCLVSVSRGKGGDNGKDIRPAHPDDEVFRSLEDETADLMAELEEPLVPKTGDCAEAQRSGTPEEGNRAQESSPA